MKRFFLPAFVLLLSATLIVSCQKEELEPASAEAPAMAELRMPTPVPAVDLQITAFGSDITATTSGCTGSPLPNVYCGGDRSFNAIVIIKNNGPGDLPAGRVDVAWVDLGVGTQRDVRTYSHPGIPAGTTIRATKFYDLGLCPIPASFTLRTFVAAVDPLDKIAETNENNNLGPRYNTCDRQ